MRNLRLVRQFSVWVLSLILGAAEIWGAIRAKSDGPITRKTQSALN